ncbi:TerD family protein [Nocardia thailandica]
MTPQKLSRGQNVPLPTGTSRIDAVIGWDLTTTEVDASALLLGADGKVGSDADFVFYNQPRSANGAVRFEGVTTTGSGARARISIDLSALPNDVHTVAVAGSVAEGTFGSFGALTFTITDGSGTPVADYTTADATTERAFVFGEVYRRAGAWKIRAVGQGWDSGLAGLAVDFGVDVTDSGDAAPTHHPQHEPVPRSTGPMAPGAAVSHYRLWGESRSWYNHELTVTDEFLPAIRSLFPADLPEDRAELTPDVELIPEPTGPRGPWGISVRAEGRTIGYLDDGTARAWAGPIRRIIASGYIPATSSRISYREYEGWDETTSYASVHLRLDQPFDAAPLNPPPTDAYTILPRSAIVQVTKEQDHFDVLSTYVTPSGHGILLVTLHVVTPESGRAKPYVEVRVGN